ncbi:Uncharacterised protein [Mycobacterium tuberculosis]|nr:Uncharacterised protein [Mycobacterium tuberculosis]
MKPLLSAWIAGSFQVVMAPLKIFAKVGPSRVSDVTVLMLKVTAMGPNTTGRFHAGEPPQRCWAAVASSGFSGESEPPKSVCLPLNSLIPAPEPLGV